MEEREDIPSKEYIYAERPILILSLAYCKTNRRLFNREKEGSPNEKKPLILWTPTNLAQLLHM